MQPDRHDFNAVVHVGACAEPPDSPQAVEVRVVGMSRPDPSIKHSQWVADRHESDYSLQRSSMVQQNPITYICLFLRWCARVRCRLVLT